MSTQTLNITSITTTVSPRRARSERSLIVTEPFTDEDLKALITELRREADEESAGCDTRS